MSPQLEDIVRKVRSDERIAPAEALVLWHEAPLWLLGELAARRKERVSGDKVYFNRNFHIEPTNLCVFNCNFCSYRRPKGSPEAWDYSLEEVERIARDHAGQGVTEVHIVGGVHPEHDLYYYVEMIRRVKAILPEATVKAFTAIELSYMIRKAGLTIDEGLRLLRSEEIAGVEVTLKNGAVYADRFLLRDAWQSVPNIIFVYTLDHHQSIPLFGCGGRKAVAHAIGIPQRRCENRRVRLHTAAALNTGEVVNGVRLLREAKHLPTLLIEEVKGRVPDAGNAALVGVQTDGKTVR